MPASARGRFLKRFQRTAPRPRGIPVLDLEGVGPVFAERLKAAGITDSEQLLRADAQALAKAAGVPYGEVRKWQDMSELLHVKGIGPQFAEVLVRCDINSVAELAQQEAGPLATRIQGYLASLGTTVVRVGVTPKLAKSWVRQARRIAEPRPDAGKAALEAVRRDDADAAGDPEEAPPEPVDAKALAVEARHEAERGFLKRFSRAAAIPKVELHEPVHTGRSLFRRRPHAPAPDGGLQGTGDTPAPAATPSGREAAAKPRKGRPAPQGQVSGGLSEAPLACAHCGHTFQPPAGKRKVDCPKCGSRLRVTEPPAAAPAEAPKEDGAAPAKAAWRIPRRIPLPGRGREADVGAAEDNEAPGKGPAAARPLPSAEPAASQPSAKSSWLDRLRRRGGAGEPDAAPGAQDATPQAGDAEAAPDRKALRAAEREARAEAKRQEREAKESAKAQEKAAHEEAEREKSAAKAEATRAKEEADAEAKRLEAQASAPSRSEADQAPGPAMEEGRDAPAEPIGRAAARAKAKEEARRAREMERAASGAGEASLWQQAVSRPLPTSRTQQGTWAESVAAGTGHHKQDSWEGVEGRSLFAKGRPKERQPVRLVTGESPFAKIQEDEHERLPPRLPDGSSPFARLPEDESPPPPKPRLPDGRSPFVVLPEDVISDAQRIHAFGHRPGLEYTTQGGFHVKEEELDAPAAARLELGAASPRQQRRQDRQAERERREKARERQRAQVMEAREAARRREQERREAGPGKGRLALRRKSDPKGTVGVASEAQGDDGVAQEQATSNTRADAAFSTTLTADPDVADPAESTEPAEGAEPAEPTMPLEVAPGTEGTPTNPKVPFWAKWRSGDKAPGSEASKAKAPSEPSTEMVEFTEAQPPSGSGGPEVPHVGGVGAAKEVSQAEVRRLRRMQERAERLEVQERKRHERKQAKQAKAAAEAIQQSAPEPVPVVAGTREGEVHAKGAQPDDPPAGEAREQAKRQARQDRERANAERLAVREAQKRAKAQEREARKQAETQARLQQEQAEADAQRDRREADERQREQVRLADEAARQESEAAAKRALDQEAERAAREAKARHEAAEKQRRQQEADAQREARRAAKAAAQQAKDALRKAALQAKEEARAAERAARRAETTAPVATSALAAPEEVQVLVVDLEDEANEAPVPPRRPVPPGKPTSARPSDPGAIVSGSQGRADEPWEPPASGEGGPALAVPSGRRKAVPAQAASQAPAAAPAAAGKPAYDRARIDAILAAKGQDAKRRP